MNYCFTTTLNKSYEPATYYEAVKDPKWIEAMNDEIEALYRNKTWTIVDLPYGRKVIGSNPVVRMVTVRCVISIAVMNGWCLYQLDVNNAFLYRDLEQDVYMELPVGYDQGNKGKVCKLNKSVYGLKQAPRQWNTKLSAALSEHGFIQSKFDYSLYIKQSGDVFLILLVSGRCGKSSTSGMEDDGKPSIITSPSKLLLLSMKRI
nr:ribonuclease H-like domain-containing protein [Tanacetum cinerariifolium]